MSFFQNSIGFEKGFGKSIQNIIFPLEYKADFSEFDILKFDFE
jgi:hypothetical protein